MLICKNHLGNIYVSKEYLISLVTSTVTGCFGVADFYKYKTRFATLNTILDKTNTNIKIRKKTNKIDVYLHVLVVYGSNMSEVVKNVKDRVSRAIFDHTGLHVNSVNVFIDAIKE